MSGNKSAGGAFIPNADYDVTGDWTYSGTQTANGAVTFSTAATFTGAASFTSAATFSGTETHSGAVSQTGFQTFTGGFVDAYETGSTSANLVNYGTSKVVLISSSSAAGSQKAFTLALPIVGYQKLLVQPTASTGGTSTVTAASGSQFNNSGNTIATFSSAGSLQLIATTSSQWNIISASTTISFA